MHNVFPIDIKFFPKVITVPTLKKRYIQADMSGIKPAIFGELLEQTVKMFDVVDLYHDYNLL